MPSTYVCVYEDCRASSWRNPDFRFAHFVKPKKNLERAKRWVELVGRPDFGIDDIKNYSVICEKHFPPGVVLNYHRNFYLEPFPASITVEIVQENHNEKNLNLNSMHKIYDSMAQENQNQNTTVEPPSPNLSKEKIETDSAKNKTYERKMKIKTVAIAVPVGHAMIQNSSTGEIDFKGEKVLCNCVDILLKGEAIKVHSVECY